MGYPSPQLDDNGDGKAGTDDGLLASNIYLNGLLTWGLRPEISEISVDQVLENISSTPIGVRVSRGSTDIKEVRAQVISPNANITGGETTISYPGVNLIYNSYTSQYEGNLTGLGRPGIYKIVVQAEDEEHEVSDPEIVYISVAGNLQAGDVNGDGDVNISDAVLALKIICGINVNVAVYADVNGDGKIGTDEVVYILQEIAGFRDEG